MWGFVTMARGRKSRRAMTSDSYPGSREQITQGDDGKNPTSVILGAGAGCAAGGAFALGVPLVWLGTPIREFGEDGGFSGAHRDTGLGEILSLGAQGVGELMAIAGRILVGFGILGGRVAARRVSAATGTYSCGI